MNDNAFLGIVLAFVLTYIAETPLLWIALHRKTDTEEILKFSFIANALTNIPLNIFLQFIVPFGTDVLTYCIIVCELIIPLIEAKVYIKSKKIGKKYTLLDLIALCYVVNFISYTLGTFIF